MYLVTVDNFTDWRQQARELLMRDISPEQVNWEYDEQHSLLLDDAGNFMAQPVVHQSLSIPKGFISAAKKIACYRCPSRWALLYSLAWRTLFEDRYIMDMAVDPQVHKAQHMIKSVGRDKHKMEAFVRFRRVDDPKSSNTESNKTEPNNTQDTQKAKESDHEYYVAWFEPDHLILPLTAPFFVNRFTNMSWSILTPDGCAHWNQEKLQFTEGVHQRPTIDDDIEKLWLNYYSNIFNPARVKLKMMQSEMPKKYWINLPEAPLIKELTRNAGHRLDQMLEHGPMAPWEKTRKSKQIKKSQKKLRERVEEDLDSIVVPVVRTPQ